MEVISSPSGVFSASVTTLGSYQSGSMGSASLKLSVMDNDASVVSVFRGRLDGWK